MGGLAAYIGDTAKAARIANQLTNVGGNPQQTEQLLDQIGGLEQAAILIPIDGGGFAPKIDAAMVNGFFGLGLTDRNMTVVYTLSSDGVPMATINNGTAEIGNLIAVKNTAGDWEWEEVVLEGEDNIDGEMSETATQIVKSLDASYSAIATRTDNLNIHDIQVERNGEPLTGINLRTPAGNFMVLIPRNYIELLSAGGLYISDQEKSEIASGKLHLDLAGQPAIEQLLWFLSNSRDKLSDPNYSRGNMGEAQIRELFQKPSSGEPTDLVLVLTPETSILNEGAWVTTVDHKDPNGNVTPTIQTGWNSLDPNGSITSGGCVDPTVQGSAYLRGPNDSDFIASGLIPPLKPVIDLALSDLIAAAYDGLMQTYHNPHVPFNLIYRQSLPFGGLPAGDPAHDLAEGLGLSKLSKYTLTEDEEAMFLALYEDIALQASTHAKNNTRFDPEDAERLLGAFFEGFYGFGSILSLR
ncbi:hypothetical protein KBD81_00365 [Candidatus Woesebacteria bacterium]|nr:hypothetical protein [Candidatus Woesebacteria bacterium]